MRGFSVSAKMGESGVARARASSNKTMFRDVRVFTICAIYLFLIHLLLSFFTTIMMLNWICWSPPQDLYYSLSEEEALIGAMNCYGSVPFSGAIILAMFLGFLWLVPCVLIVWSLYKYDDRNGRYERSCQTTPTADTVL